MINAWLLWGLALAALTFWLDRRPMPPALWLLAGVLLRVVAAGSRGREFNRFHDWYHVRILGRDRRSRMLEQLRMHRAHQTETEEYKRLIDEQIFVTVLAVMPSVASIQGVVFGPILGALLGRQLGLTATAFRGSVLGLLVGPVVFSEVIVLAYACAYRPVMPIPRREQRMRRGLLAVAPLVLAAALWHALTAGNQPEVREDS
jgi:hypothetical protein